MSHETFIQEKDPTQVVDVEEQLERTHTKIFNRTSQ